MKMNLYIFALSLILVSCVKKLPSQFADSNQSKKNNLYSIKDIISTDCTILTGRVINKGLLESQAQKWTIEANKKNSVIFNAEEQSTPSIINNLPTVEYKVQGSDICKTLLNQKSLEFMARPFTTYPIKFQITKNKLRIFAEGQGVDLPYHQLTGLNTHDTNQFYQMPIGGYSLKQGEIRNVKNLENKETHILDFFPNTHAVFENIPKEGFYTNKIRTGANTILIDHQSFSPYQYLEKTDILPKSYFEGTWYSGVSVTSVEPLFAQSVGFSSGRNISGDNYSGLTAGQKVFFHFDAQHLRAINENYQKQSSQLALMTQAEAEVLSFPIKHRDYKNVFQHPSASDSLTEELDTDIAWNKKRYVAIDFSQIDHYFKKRINNISQRYGLNFNQNKTTSTTIREIKFAHNYFDILIYDGNLEYRFSFLKKDPNDNYKPKTINTADKRFEYFSLPDKRAFYKPESSFKKDYEQNVHLLRVQPNEKNQIVLNFSKSTPQKEKIRSISREAVSLWNQAFQQAGLSLSLVIDESKDVDIGDIRYHILHSPVDLPIGLLGIAQMYADDDTGQVISSSSTIHLNNIINYLKKMIIHHTYSKHNLLDTSNFITTRQKQIPISKYGLNYFSFQNQLSHISSLDPIKFPHSPEQWSEHVNLITQRNQYIQKAPTNIFTQLNESIAKQPIFQNWFKQLKINYALNTGRYIEDESFQTIQEASRRWSIEKWSEFQGIETGQHFSKLLSYFCRFISHPTKNSEQFQIDVRRCASRIYPIYALGTAVHEIGHSIFSLTHNFAGSVDQKNIQPQTEYKLEHLNPHLSFIDNKNTVHLLSDWFPSVSSSVMDYIHPSHGEQWAPGLYDKAAVQYLYKDLVPFKESYLSQNEEFIRCTDWEEGDSSLCLHLDTGTTPEEQTLSEVQTLISVLESSDSLDTIDNSYYSFYKSMYRLVTIYYDWRKQLAHFISEKKTTNSSQISIEDYTALLNEIVQRGKSPNATQKDKERLSLYKSRNLIYHTLSYISAIPNMYCILEAHENPEEESKSSRQVIVEISKVLKHYRNQQRYIQKDLTSCWKDETQTTTHPMLQEYIALYYPNFHLVEERGRFLLPHLFPKNLTYQSIDPSYVRSYQGTFWFRNASFAAMTLTEYLFPNDSSLAQFHEHPVTMMNERDIEQGIDRLLLARLTRGVYFPKEHDFLKQVQQISLEDLTPEKSASLLFEFPEIQEDINNDIVFRDEFIQSNKLIKDASQKHRRDDQHNIQFFQNFHEEEGLLSNNISFYMIGKLIAGGSGLNELKKRSQYFTSNIQAGYSLTGELLMNKALNYLDYQANPHIASSYYFDFNNFFITPSYEQNLSDGISHIIISELAKNSVRDLWTTANYNKFIANPENNIGFTQVILSYLQGFSKLQENRLGRFYFMYIYTVILGLLETYEQMIAYNSEPDIHKLHEQVKNQVLPFTQNIQRLFHFEKCPSHTFTNLPSQKEDTETCPEGVFTKKGKLQTLYSTQARLLIQQNSIDENVTLNTFDNLTNFPAKNLHNDFQEIIQNYQLNNNIQSLEYSVGHPTHQALYLMHLFYKYFPFSDNKEEILKLIKIHRQLLIDIIPKMMLMYSSDRYFIGEMMWIMGNMYNACMYGRGLSHICSLQIEKLTSYYFSGTLYGTNQKLERSFIQHLTGKKTLVDGGMPLEDLINHEPNDIMDQFIASFPFFIFRLQKHLFDERKWYEHKTFIEENEAQKRLLLQLFPLAYSRIQNSTLFYKPYGR